MKTKIFALVAAFFMLMGGSAWAQADVKGDVNGDGVVNEQDIAAILAIMAKNNGVAEKTKYYWYVGFMRTSDTEDITKLLQTVDGQNPTSSSTGPSQLVIPTGTGDRIVYIYPEVWGTPNIVDNTGYGTGDTKYEEFGWPTPVGYKALEWDGDHAVRGKTLYITWTK